MIETDQPLPDTLPPPGILDELDVAGIRVSVFRTALELDVFATVAGGNATASEVAAAIGCPVDPTAILLDALGSFGILTFSDGRYALAPVAAAYLDPASPTFLGAYYLDEMRARDRFVECVRTGHPARDVRSRDAEHAWFMFATFDASRWEETLPLWRSGWAGVGVTPELRPGARVLDVGCGSGGRAFTVALDDPTAHVVAVDSAPVLRAAERLSRQMGVADQVRLVPGDATTLSELDESFDVVLFGFVLHYFDLPEIASILDQARRLVRSGGRLVILAPLAASGDYENPDPFLTAVWMLNVAPRGRVYTLDEYSDMVTEAGFEKLSRLEGTPWLYARPLS